MYVDCTHNIFALASMSEMHDFKNGKTKTIKMIRIEQFEPVKSNRGTFIY